MSKEHKFDRLAELNSEFRNLIGFHERSYQEIDSKAKYWLTLTLTAFIALAGYLTKEWAELPLPVLVGGSALSSCLFLSTYLFSSVLLSMRIESGILVPASRKISDAEYFLESDEHWKELRENQSEEVLRALANNEKQNARKSARLRRGEVSLFRGTPTAICLAGGSAFIYAAACPSGFSASAARVAATGTVAGIAIGAATLAAFVAFDHAFTTKRKNL